MKYKNWYKNWDIHFERKWKSDSKDQLKVMLEICLHLSNLKKCVHIVYLSVKYKDWSTKSDI